MSEESLCRGFKLLAIGLWGGDDLTEFGADVGRKVIEVLHAVFGHVLVTLLNKFLRELRGFAELFDDSWEDA